MSAVAELLGHTVIDHNPSNVPIEQFTGEGKVVGLYFSAHWCPPCRGFTPKLANFYRTIKASPKKDRLEIVFVSSDNDETSWKEYFGEMPWLALDYADREREEHLSNKFNVRGIPTLIFLDGNTGAVLHEDGDEKVEEDPTGQNFPW